MVRSGIAFILAIVVGGSSPSSTDGPGLSTQALNLTSLWQRSDAPPKPPVNREYRRQAHAAQGTQRGVAAVETMAVLASVAAAAKGIAHPSYGWVGSVVALLGILTIYLTPARRMTLEAQWDNAALKAHLRLAFGEMTTTETWISPHVLARQLGLSEHEFQSKLNQLKLTYPVVPDDLDGLASYKKPKDGTPVSPKELTAAELETMKAHTIVYFPRDPSEKSKQITESTLEYWRTYELLEIDRTTEEPLLIRIKIQRVHERDGAYVATTSPVTMLIPTYRADRTGLFALTLMSPVSENAPSNGQPAPRADHTEDRIELRVDLMNGLAAIQTGLIPWENRSRFAARFGLSRETLVEHLLRFKLIYPKRPTAERNIRRKARRALRPTLPQLNGDALAKSGGYLAAQKNLTVQQLVVHKKSRDRLQPFLNVGVVKRWDPERAVTEVNFGGLSAKYHTLNLFPIAEAIRSVYEECRQTYLNAEIDQALGFAHSTIQRVIAGQGTVEGTLHVWYALNQLAQQSSQGMIHRTAEDALRVLFREVIEAGMLQELDLLRLDDSEGSLTFNPLVNFIHREAGLVQENLFLYGSAYARIVIPERFPFWRPRAVDADPLLLEATAEREVLKNFLSRYIRGEVASTDDLTPVHRATQMFDDTWIPAVRDELESVRQRVQTLVDQELYTFTEIAEKTGTERQTISRIYRREGVRRFILFTVGSFCTELEKRLSPLKLERTALEAMAALIAEIVESGYAPIGSWTPDTKDRNALSGLLREPTTYASALGRMRDLYQQIPLPSWQGAHRQLDLEMKRRRLLTVVGRYVQHKHLSTDILPRLNVSLEGVQGSQWFKQQVLEVTSLLPRMMTEFHLGMRRLVQELHRTNPELPAIGLDTLQAEVAGKPENTRLDWRHYQAIHDTWTRFHQGQGPAPKRNKWSESAA